MSQAALNIVVAHSLEAKPLIEMLNLKKCVNASTYPLYQNDHGVCLIVSGMGKTSSAAATAYLFAKQEVESTAVRAWLNLGIAGHQTAELGDGLLANKITDRSTGLSYFPSMLFSGFASSEVITVDEPELEYLENATYEMEATGFYSTATRLVTSELVQVFKVISDNPANHVHNMDLACIKNWILGQQEQILEIVRQLDEAAQDFNAVYSLPVEYAELEGKCKFSVTQKNQLKRMCQRYLALKLQAQLQYIVKNSKPVAKQILKDLQSGLSDIA